MRSIICLLICSVAPILTSCDGSSANSASETPSSTSPSLNARSNKQISNKSYSPDNTKSDLTEVSARKKYLLLRDEIRKISPEGFQELLAQIINDSNGTLKLKLIDEFFGRAAALDSAKARELFEQIPPGIAADGALCAILKNSPLSDVLSNIAWFERFEEPSVSMNLRGAAAQAFSKCTERQMRDIIGKTKSSAMLNAAAQCLGMSIAKGTESRTLLSLAKDIPLECRGSFLVSGCSVWAEREKQASLEAILSTKNNDQDLIHYALPVIVGANAESNPVETLNEVIVSGDSKISRAATEIAIRRWLHFDSLKSSEYVSNMPPSFARVVAVQEVLGFVEKNGREDEKVLWRKFASENSQTAAQ